tara:strand:+ start:2192 stop:2746 length:555 start_codon:yes stop_codon:yes gene_type:complete
MIKLLTGILTIILSYHTDCRASGDPGPTIDQAVEVGNITFDAGTQGIGFADITGAQNVEVIGNFCVYSNVLAVPATDTTPSFQIKADAGGTGSFLLGESFAGALTSTIPFTVILSNGLESSAPLTEGIQTGNLKLTAFPGNTCSQGWPDNIEMTVSIASAALAAAPAGVYTRTITLTVYPPTVS